MNAAIHLADHEYSICIRQEEGFCCVQYQVCTLAAEVMVQQMELITITEVSATKNTFYLMIYHCCIKFAKHFRYLFGIHSNFMCMNQFVNLPQYSNFIFIS